MHTGCIFQKKVTKIFHNNKQRCDSDEHSIASIKQAGFCATTGIVRQILRVARPYCRAQSTSVYHSHKINCCTPKRCNCHWISLASRTGWRNAGKPSFVYKYAIRCSHLTIILCVTLICHRRGETLLEYLSRLTHVSVTGKYSSLSNR